jgi:hypothetical protein
MRLRLSQLIAQHAGMAAPLDLRPGKIQEELIHSATTRYFYALKIYGAILPQNKQILCRYFTIKQHWTIFLKETLTEWQRATS